jgi:hypothetical protein
MISIQAAGTRLRARPAPQDARTAKPKPRLKQSRVAKPLLTSLATATLLAGAFFATVAAYSTGSLQPWRWSHANWSVAAVRYQACAQQGQGVGVFGCMLRAGIRPASAADMPAGGAAQKGAPMYSLQTIHDPAPPAQPGASSASTHSSAPPTGSTAGPGSQHVVSLPTNPPRPQPPQPQPQSSPQPQPSPPPDE